MPALKRKFVLTMPAERLVEVANTLLSSSGDCTLEVNVSVDDVAAFLQAVSTVASDTNSRIQAPDIGKPGTQRITLVPPPIEAPVSKVVDLKSYKPKAIYVRPHGPGLAS